MAMAELTLNDDRLFPPDPTTRGFARKIYATTRGLPIISPHGHVPPAWLSDNVPFKDPTSLLITPDHYINRIMHANGVELSDLGVGRGELSEADSRKAFRLLCEHFPDYNGTVMRYWLVDSLVNIFGVTQRPSAQTSDAIYDTIQAWIDDEKHRPRELMDTFNIEFIATTDDPCDSLDEHAKLAADSSFTAKHRMTPTFRPDKYLEPARADWHELLAKLADVSGIDPSTLDGFTAAMENRRAHFKARGGISVDHSHKDLESAYLDKTEADKLFAKCFAGQASVDECTLMRKHLLGDQIRMASEDGMTVTLHPAVYRNHDEDAFATYGADVGHDIPTAVECTYALQPMLTRYGNNPNFKIVIIVMDETTFSREVAPLVGWYRSAYVGPAWWFIDSPEAIMRQKRAITEMAGFTRSSGMIDDTRAFCSIPARHDMSRRLDAAHLAELVASHRLDLDEAIETAHRLVADNPRKVFNL